MALDTEAWTAWTMSNSSTAEANGGLHLLASGKR